jgi:hypothetical protein
MAYSNSYIIFKRKHKLNNNDYISKNQIEILEIHLKPVEKNITRYVKEKINL